MKKHFVTLMVVFSLFLPAMERCRPLTEPVDQDEESRSDDTNPLGLSSRYGYSEEELKKFQGWIKQTIEKSRERGAAAIIVDKAAYKLFLIRNGRLEAVFPVELGRNPYDDKVKEGDSCTPEGFYKVTWKRDRGNTIFYRALFINYPNGKDKEEFRSLVESGQLPPGAKTGGDIEIHGSGSGKPGNAGGYNWTLGCVALSNEDIDVLFEAVETYCPVIIVRYGSSTIPSLSGEE